jgi:putative FmdB family regulatory protein
VPTYSYRCTECGTAFDIQQSFSDASLTVCPTCGGVLRKVFSPIGVSFTGSGFYRNDSRAKPGGEKGAPEKTSTEKTSTEKASTEKASPVKEKAASTPSTGSGTGKAATSSAAS